MHPKLLAIGTLLVGGVGVVGGIIHSFSHFGNYGVELVNSKFLEDKDTVSNTPRVSRIPLDSDSWNCRIFKLTGRGGASVNLSEKIIKEEVLDQVGFMDSLGDSHRVFKEEIKSACSGTGSSVLGEIYGDIQFGTGGGGTRYVLIYEEGGEWKNEKCGEDCKRIWEGNKGMWGVLGVKPEGS